MLQLQAIVLCVLQIAILVQCNSLFSNVAPKTSKPSLGTWTKEYLKKEQTQTNFDIKEYVLPKYEVNIKVPKDVAIADVETPVTIKAQYGYGKLVKETDFVSANANFSVADDGQQQQAVDKTVNIDGKGIGKLNLLSSRGRTPA